MHHACSCAGLPVGCAHYDHQSLASGLPSTALGPRTSTSCTGKRGVPGAKRFEDFEILKHTFPCSIHFRNFKALHGLRRNQNVLLRFVNTASFWPACCQSVHNAHRGDSLCSQRHHFHGHFPLCRVHLYGGRCGAWVRSG